MEYTVILADLQKALQKVLPAIPSKSTVNILEHIYLKLSEGNLQLVATDQNITIISKISVESNDEFEILVPAKTLNDIVKALGNTGSVTFSIDLENYDINLHTSRGTYGMKGLDAEEYIEIPQLFGDTELPDIENNDGLASSSNDAFFTKEQLNYLCDKTLYSVSTDEYRISMTGVLFQFRETFVNAVGTDSFRLSKAVVKSEKPIFPQNFDLLLPSRSVDILKKIGTDTKMTTIESFGKITHARFDFNDTIFITRILNEKFPPYESVLPQSNEIIMSVDIDEFLSSLKRVALFSNEKSRHIKLTMTANNLNIFAEDEDTNKQGEENISCEFNTDNYEIVFNHKFLIEAIEHLDAKESNDNILKMFFSEPSKPVLILPNNDNDDLLFLVMPIRISSNNY